MGYEKIVLTVVTKQLIEAQCAFNQLLLNTTIPPAVRQNMVTDALAKSFPDKCSSFFSTPDSTAMIANQISGLSSVRREVSIESVARYFGGNGYIPKQTTSGRIHHCIDAAAELVDPQATYTLFPISSIIPGKEVTLANGPTLSLPECFADPGARHIAAIIGTLGAGLEKHCRNLAGRGALYESTLFDAIGNAMLDLLSDTICKALEEIGKQFGLVKGPRFAPGIDGCPLEQQHLLFQMADHASVGVLLNSSAVMMPTKSISFFMILTQTVGKSVSENKCNLCRMRKCQFRRLP